MKTVIHAAVLMLPAAMFCSAQERNEKGVTAKDLVGVYEMVGIERDGEKLPADRVKGSQVRITEDKIVSTDKDSKETFACSYKLDSSKTPTVITMVSTLSGQEGQVVKGLIQAAGDQVRLIYTLPDGTKPPKVFKTEPGQLMLVLKKTKE